MKHIHFYKDAKSLANNKFYKATHNETKYAIDCGVEDIHTTALTALDLDLLDCGYRIFLHENNKCVEMKIGSVDCTNKEIRKGHNIERLWCAGAFYDYFYR